MLERFVPQKRALYGVALLLGSLLLALTPFLGLNATEILQFVVLLLFGFLYAVLTIRSRSSHSKHWSYIIIPANVLLVTLAFVILHRVLPSIWVIYFVLPISAALAYGSYESFAAGILSTLAYVVLEYGFRLNDDYSLETIVNALVILILSIIPGLLVNRAQRYQKELVLYNKVNQALNMAVSVEELLETIYRELARVLKFDSYYVAIYDEAKKELDFAIGLDRNNRETRYRRPASEGLAGLVVRTSKPILIHDFPAVMDTLPSNERWGTDEPPRRSILLVPILRRPPGETGNSAKAESARAESSILGVLSVQSSQRHAYTNDDLHLMEGIAHSVSYALERARLYEQLQQQRVGEQAVSLQFSQELLGLLEPGTVLDRALAIAAQALKADFSDIWLDDGQDFQFIPGAGWKDESLNMPRAQNLAESGIRWAITHRRPVIINDVPADDRFQTPSFVLERGIRATIITPLITGERVIGAIAVSALKPRQWSGDEIHLLSLIANQTALAHERTRLWSSYQSRVQTIQILYDTAQSFAAMGNLKETIRIVTESAARLLGGSSCFVTLFTSGQDHLEIMRPAWGIAEKELEAARDEIASGILQQWQPSQVLLVNDITQLPEALRGWANRFGVRTMLAVWLISQGRPVGTLHVSNKIRDLQFTSEDVRLATTLANQAAVAIQNARLYESLRDSEARYRVLSEASLLGVYLIQGSRFVYANPALANILGYSTHQLVSEMHPLDIVHSEDRLLVAENIQQRDTGDIEKTRTEFRVLRPDGTIRFVESFGTRIGYEGQPATLGTILDITERKRTEIRLEQQLRALRTLAKIDREITAASDSQTVLDLVCQSALDLLHVPKAAIWLTLSPTLTKLVASAGLADPFFRADQVDETPFPTIPGTQEGSAPILSINEIPPDDEELVSFQEREHVRSSAQAVLTAEGSPFGALFVFDTQPREWSQDQIQLLDLLAGQASIAIARTRLLDTTRVRLRETLLLNRVIAATASTPDTVGALQFVCAELARTFSLPQVAVALRQDEHTARIVAEYRESLQPTLLNSIIPLDDSPDADDFQQNRTPFAFTGKSFDPRLVPGWVGLGADGLGSAFILPLVSRDQVFGTIGLISNAARTFTPEEIALAQNATAAVGQSLENSELLNQAQERLARLTALHDITRAMNSRVSLQERLDRLLEMTLEHIQAKVGIVWLLDETKSELQVLAQRGLRAPQLLDDLRLSVSEGAAGWILTHREPLYIPNVEEDERWVTTDSAEREGLVSYLGIPLRIEDKIIGVLDIGAHSPRSFTQEQIDFLSTLGSQAAVAIENARLYESANADRQRLGLLYELSRELSTSLDATTIFRRSASLIVRAFGGLLAEGIIYAPQNQILRLITYPRANDDTQDQNLRLVPNLSEGLAEWVAATRQPMLINDLRQNPHWVPTQDIDTQARSALSVPFLVQDQILGVLTILSELPNAFKPDQLDLLISLGHQISIVLSNAQLYDEAKKRVREFGALYESLQELTAQTDLPYLLEMITNRAMELFHAPGGALAIYDSTHRALVPVYTHGYTLPSHSGLLLGDGLVGRVAETRQPIVVPDYQVWENRLEAFAVSNLRSIVAVPILHHGELLGTLAILETGESTRQFSESDARLLSLFAAQAAGMIHNARLIEQARVRADQFGLFYDAGLALNSALDSHSQLEYLIKITARALRAERATFHRFVSATGEFIHEVSFGPGPIVLGNLQQLHFRLGDERGIIGWVGARGLPLNLPDVTQDKRWLDIDADIRSALFVPVEHEMRVLGVLSVFSTKVEAFGLTDERLLALFANLLAVAIENARLLSETERRAQEAETLRQAASFAVGALEPEEAVERILIQLESVVPYDSASVQLLREDYLEIVGGRGWPRPDLVRGMRFPVPGENPNTLVVQSRQPVVLGNTHQLYEKFLEPVHQLILSWLGVPLIVHDRVIGILAVDSQKPNYYGADHVRLATAFAEHVAIALENARLFAEAQNRARESSALYELALSLANVLDTNELLARVYERVRELVPSDVFFVGLYDSNTDVVTLAVAIENGQPVAQGLQIPSDEAGLTGWLIKTRQPLLVRDMLRETLPASPRHLTRIARSWLGIPLIARDRVLGVLSVQSSEPDVFGDEDSRFLQSIAGLVANALDNAQLFDETRRQLSEQETVNEIAKQLRSIESLEEALDYFLEAVLALINTSAGSILLYNPEDNHVESLCGRGWLAAMRVRPELIGDGSGVLGTREPYLVHEFASDLLASPIAGPGVPAGWGGVCVPIYDINQLIGSMIIAVPLPRQIAPSQVQVLKTLAEIMGLTIHRLGTGPHQKPTSGLSRRHRTKQGSPS
ncbi:MAG TPA: GAF domain-containing protein [Anaerolineae bacterium]